MEEKIIQRLIKEAMAQLAHSYSPYSKFKVGAALLAENGMIYTGCNIENAAYSPSNCAERTAFFKAVSEGIHDFSAICIVGGHLGKVEAFCPPCGVCRQVMVEFCDQETFLVILAISQTEYQVFTLKELLPMSFGPKTL